MQCMNKADWLTDWLVDKQVCLGWFGLVGLIDRRRGKTSYPLLLLSLLTREGVLSFIIHYSLLRLTDNRQAGKQTVSKHGGRRWAEYHHSRCKNLSFFTHPPPHIHHNYTTVQLAFQTTTNQLPFHSSSPKSPKQQQQQHQQQQTSTPPTKEKDPKCSSPIPSPSSPSPP